MAVVFNGNASDPARIFRSGLDNTRDGLYKLQRTRATMNAMTLQQIVDVYGVSAQTDGTPQSALQQAATLKAEVDADILALTVNGTVDVATKTNQLFAMTG